MTNSPNQRLKTERELRGWSQKHVADQIGADHYYLSRWERGTTTPSPYYRQRLCDLFGKNAQELGLLLEEAGGTREALNEYHTSNVGATGRIHDPALPPPSLEAAALVGRDEMLFQLRERLCAGRNLVLTALNGIPGVGKTTLAIALSHDEEVLARFRDGVLWAGIGPKPHILGLLSRWGSLLGVTNADAANLTSVEGWSQVLRSAIGTRQMLLVLDDVWEIEEALAFKVGGPQCAYLVTTCLPHIALCFAAEGTTLVQELNERESMTLLERLVPTVVKSERKAVADLVQVVGGLPLALTLMGKYLRTQAHSGQPHRIRAAIESLRNVEVRLRLSEPQALLERTAGLPEQTPVSLEAVIAVSTQQMDEQTRMALYRLAVFPAKPNTFSEESALAVCQTSVETLDALSDAGILESRGPGRYTLHQTIADYARTQLTDTAAYERLAAYFADYVQAHEQDDDMLEEDSSNVFAALQAAFEQKQHVELVRGVHAFVRFLQARGLYDQVEVHLKRAYQSASLLQDLGTIATTLCYLGEVAEIRSDLDQAEGYLLEGLALARQCGETELIIRLLQPLGFVTSIRGDYVQAEAYLQETKPVKKDRQASLSLSH